MMEHLKCVFVSHQYYHPHFDPAARGYPVDPLPFELRQLANHLYLYQTFRSSAPGRHTSEPLSVNLPDMQPGEVFYGELTLTNYGLIQANDLKFDLPSDQYFKYELLGDLPISLGAKERITIPYRVTALKALDQSADGSGGGCKHYYQTFRVTYTYQCTDGTERQDSQTVTFVRTEGDCSGSAGFGGFGSGGGGCVGADCGGNQTNTPPTKISPNSIPIDGVECWPVAERWDDTDNGGTGDGDDDGDRGDDPSGTRMPQYAMVALRTWGVLSVWYNGNLTIKPPISA